MPYVPPKDPTVVEDWDEMPRSAATLKVNGHLIKNFAPLREFRQLTELAVSCKTEAQYEIVGSLISLTKLSLAFVETNVFGLLKNLAGLESLLVDRYEGDTLQGIESLSSLRELRLLDCNKLHDLGALKGLHDLERLYISTPASWDSSRKVLSVPSLEPLSFLARLQSLILRGVEPSDKSLKSLEGLQGLRELQISHVYSFQLEDYARLAALLPQTKGDCLIPYYKLNVQFPCRKCGTEEVFLTGSTKGAKRKLCPTCNSEKLAAHARTFEALKEQANKTKQLSRPIE